jgi:hypothetical protein
MKIIKRSVVVAGAAAALPLFAATGASAAGSTATTHTTHHADTCSCTTNVTSDNGDVWAYDNLSRQFVVTTNSDGTYNVVLTDSGKFSAFAEPNNPDPSTYFPIKAQGAVKGTITFTVTSPNGPVGLPGQEPGTTSTTETVQQLFGGHASSIVDNAYTYTYTSGSQTYTQSSSTGITGDITGK